MVMAPIVRGRKGEYGKQLEELRGEGFTRVKVDGELRLLEEEIVLDKKFKHDILGRGRPAGHAAGAAQAAGRLGGDRGRAGRRDHRDRDGAREDEEAGGLHLLRALRVPALRHLDAGARAADRSRSTRRTARARAAPGLGSQMEIDPDLVVPDPSLSIGEGRSCRGRARARRATTTRSPRRSPSVDEVDLDVRVGGAAEEVRKRKPRTPRRPSCRHCATSSRPWHRCSSPGRPERPATSPRKSAGSVFMYGDCASLGSLGPNVDGSHLHSHLLARRPWLGLVPRDSGESPGMMRQLTVAFADCGNALAACPPESIVATQVVRNCALYCGTDETRRTCSGVGLPAAIAASACDFSPVSISTIFAASPRET